MNANKPICAYSLSTKDEHWGQSLAEFPALPITEYDTE